MGVKINDVRAWAEVDPLRFNSPEARSNAALLDCIGQFDVKNNPRYQKRAGNTFCFTYVWDATKALMCEVPHWADETTGEKRPPGKGKELDINHGIGWLRMFGLNHGWMKCGREKAVERALDGYPTIVVWENMHGPHGHVALIIGGTERNPLISQAGAVNGEMRLTEGLGNAGPLEFFTHD